MARIPLMDEYACMSPTENGISPVASMDEIQKSWHDLTLRVEQLETGNSALEHENKSLRQLLERAIEHRKKSHADLVNLLTTLVSKLPLNDVGVIVSRLVEHNVQVGDVCAALVHGKNDDAMLQPAILKTLDKTKRELNAAIPPLVEELIRLDAPLEAAMQAGLRDIVKDILDSLTPREAKVLRMRFGIEMSTDHTLEEVGKQFDVTRERIRQIEAKALRKLKHPSRSDKLRSFIDTL